MIYSGKLDSQIKISKKTKETLAEYKLVPTETYDSIIQRLLAEVQNNGR